MTIREFLDDFSSASHRRRNTHCHKTSSNVSRPCEPSPALQQLRCTSSVRGRTKCVAQSFSRSQEDLLLRRMHQKWKPSSAVYVRGVTKCFPLNVDRKLYSSTLIVVAGAELPSMLTPFSALPEAIERDYADIAQCRTIAEIGGCKGNSHRR